MIPGKVRGKEGNSKGKDGSCRRGCSMDHRKGVDGRMGNDDKHEKEGYKNRKKGYKGEVERGCKGAYEDGVETKENERMV